MPNTVTFLDNEQNLDYNRAYFREYKSNKGYSKFN